jgi:hypothetical protein
VTPVALVGLLAESTRMRVFAAVLLGASTPTEVAERTGITLRDAMAALRRLQKAGLVLSHEGVLTARPEIFTEVAKEHGAVRTEEDPLDPDAARAAVLRSFIVEGRLTAIPAPWAKRRIVLEHVARSFVPGVRYPERDVNAVLRAWHPDYAALRRYLVDEELLARDAGVYWRIGGPTDEP